METISASILFWNKAEICLQSLKTFKTIYPKGWAFFIPEKDDKSKAMNLKRHE